MKKLYTLMLTAMLAMLPQMLMGSVQKLTFDHNKAAKTTLERVGAAIKKAPQSRAEGNWTLLGTGKYTDDILTVTGMPLETWEVEIYENADTKGFYRVENPYGNGKCPHFEGEAFESCDILIHAENPDAVYMEYVELSNIDLGLGVPGYIGDMAGYYITMGWFDAETVIGMGMCSGKMVGGCVTFGKGDLIIDFPEFGDSGMTFKTNSSGAFMVALPGASDFSFKTSETSICAESVLEVPYQAGADLDVVKYDVFKGFLNYRDSDNDLYEKVKAEGKTATDGKIQAELAEGVNTLVIVALAPSGDIMARKQIHCYGQPEAADQWKAIGQAEYSEDLLFSIYPEDVKNVVYKVDVQENINTPGLYRLVDLYGPSYPYYEALSADNNIVPCNGHHHYVTVDATNPDRVFIEASPLGLDFGYGQVTFFSEGWFTTVEGNGLDSSAAAEGFGTMKDNKITFPGGALFIYMPDYGLPRGNINHKFYIQLPETTGIEGIEAGSRDKVEYFNLTGAKVDNPTAGGIYIRRTGAKAEKVVIR